MRFEFPRAAKAEFSDGENCYERQVPGLGAPLPAGECIDAQLP